MDGDDSKLSKDLVRRLKVVFHEYFSLRERLSLILANKQTSDRRLLADLHEALHRRFLWQTRTQPPRSLKHQKINLSIPT